LRNALDEETGKPLDTWRSWGISLERWEEEA